MPLSFWAALLMLLAERFQEAHGKQLRWHEFRLIALDGTTINLPNWQALRDHFGSAKNGKSWRAQARMVMLQFPLARLPFRYELGTLAEGERAVASRLLERLCCNDLVLMDQGFWSYRLFWQIDQQHAYFAIRRFAQARFRTVQRLGPKDRLVDWRPSDPRQRRGLPESIRLRVIDYQITPNHSRGNVVGEAHPTRLAISTTLVAVRRLFSPALRKMQVYYAPTPSGGSGDRFFSYFSFSRGILRRRDLRRQ